MYAEQSGSVLTQALADGPLEAVQVRPPYGPAIPEAIARGDLNDMRAAAESARRTLADCSSADCTTAVHQALEELDEAIRQLERRGHPQDPE
jgi:hypothetical protein